MRSKKSKKNKKKGKKINVELLYFNKTTISCMSSQDNSVCVSINNKPYLEIDYQVWLHELDTDIDVIKLFENKQYPHLWLSFIIERHMIKSYLYIIRESLYENKDSSFPEYPIEDENHFLYKIAENIDNYLDKIRDKEIKKMFKLYINYGKKS